MRSFDDFHHSEHYCPVVDEELKISVDKF